MSDNNFYVVYKQGMFGHGIHAISENKPLAENIALQAAADDTEHNHSYDVYRVPQDTLSEPSGNEKLDFGWMNHRPAFSTRKREPLHSPTPPGSSDTKVFVVYKQGFYGHGAHAISFEQEKAEALADECAKRDHDSYHSYDVYPVYLDILKRSNLDPKIDQGWMNIDPIYSVRKES
jgi:hypothetical protein